MGNPHERNQVLSRQFHPEQTKLLKGLINGVIIPQHKEVKYLGLNLERHVRQRKPTETKELQNIGFKIKTASCGSSTNAGSTKPS